MGREHLRYNFLLAGEANQALLKRVLSPNPGPKLRIELTGSEEEVQRKSIYFILKVRPLPRGLFSERTIICAGREVLETVIGCEGWDAADYRWSQIYFEHQKLSSENPEGQRDSKRTELPFHISYSCAARGAMIVVASEHPDEIYLRASQDDDTCLRAADCMAFAWRIAATSPRFDTLRYIFMVNLVGETCELVRECNGEDASDDGYVRLSPKGNVLAREWFKMFSGSPYGRCVYDLLIRYKKEFDGLRVKHLMVYSQSQLGPGMANTTGGLWGPTLVWELEPSKGDDLEW